MGIAYWRGRCDGRHTDSYGDRLHMVVRDGKMYKLTHPLISRATLEIIQVRKGRSFSKINESRDIISEFKIPLFP
ncbi:hypothetical protein EYC80_003835 [Monilinia laxa]|uniref:Uncharacterized protein n=1 Tax=Monilinia laxa TaxID=61186 RepID=A0A5N6KL86_MONLA|nr:hypothetical protein EYC80_003835 [Monilinia laxa]